MRSTLIKTIGTGAVVAVCLTGYACQAMNHSAGGSLVATAKHTELRVFAHPDDGHAALRLTAPLPHTPVSLLVEHRQGPWVQVALPVRPNGSTGWVRAGAVTLASDPYAIEVSLGAHTLVLRRDGKPVLKTVIAVGASATPTPTGRFATSELIRTADPTGVYGPFAFGLTAHSDVLTDFAGGDGRVGIHGTNEPALLGRSVSHGCIRVPNDVITRIAGLVPLGTPVTVHE